MYILHLALKMGHITMLLSGTICGP